MSKLGRASGIFRREMKKKAKKEVRLEKIDQAFKKIGQVLGKDPAWREWIEAGGPEFLDMVSEELEEIKPSLEEMLLDLVEAGWVLENPDGDFNLLAKRKKDVVTALWKLTQMIKGYHRERGDLVGEDGRAEEEGWPKRLDG